METPRELPLSDAAILPDSAESMLAYPVLVGTGAIEAASDLCRAFPKVALIADETVLRLHRSRLGALENLPTFVLPSGEVHKDWAQLGQVLDFMADAGLSRDSLLLTFGGGVTGDMGGLAASLFKRGLAVGHMPTTLLAQVDASVGGKTAGTFHAPHFVLADLDVLETQALHEWQSGLGEVVKTALLARAPLFEELEHAAPMLGRPDGDRASLASIVLASIRTKAQWVQTDPTEQGSRKALNLGHTFGHAIEHAAGYGVIPHGIAVAMGLVLALRTSHRAGVLTNEDLEPRCLDLLKTLGLPRTWSQWSAARHHTITTDAIIQGLAHDKKGAFSNPRFVLPQTFGKVLWDQEIDEKSLRQIIGDWLAS
ncbi:MAG: 3-dehydroquinate synthase [Planctomycetota bacterium]|nr:3-dehydroquinate synthase [Planctomycetota bacterium]